MTESPTENELLDFIGDLELDGRPLVPPRLLARSPTDREGLSASTVVLASEEGIPHPLLFAQMKDPVAQRQHTWVDEIPLPPDASVLSVGLKLGTSFARVVHGLLEPNECAEILACANRKGFTALASRYRCILDCPELTGYLFEVIRPHLPETLMCGRERIQELNERCRFTCYTPGQEFALHCDAIYQRPHGHAKEGQSSRITVQFYLHDVPASNGGATTFIGRRQVSCQPSCGSALIFTQDLLHEGTLLNGGVKFTMRTEVMYGEDHEAKALQELIDSI